MKHHAQNILARKGFIRFTNCSFSMEEVKIRTLAGLKPRGRSYCKDHEGMLLIGLLSTLCSAFFFIEPWTTSLSMTPATVGLDPPPALTKKMPCCWSYGGIFSIEVTSSQMIQAYQVDIKLASMPAPIKFFIYLHICLYCALENQRAVGSLGA